MSRLPPVAEMQTAYLERDATYDGVFYLAVRTTGIFCRPSCAARKPLPKNVEYFGTVREAVFSGYRPCKRCRPLACDGTPPEWVARLLAAVENSPTRRIRDSDTRKMGIDPARARRYFQARYGMTFQAYCRGRRMSQAFREIKNGATVTQAAFDQGFQSESGFRAAYAKAFARGPSASRDSECIVTSWIESPVGPLLAGATSQGLCLLEFSDRRMLEAQFETLKSRFDASIVPGSNEHLESVGNELKAYFAGDLRRFRTPLIYPGTPFQTRVWNGLLEIPYGVTCSYEDLANRIGAVGAQRAVGHANGLNRIAILIPCHRVVNKGGKLGGYGGGLWRKQALLDLERGLGISDNAFELTNSRQGKK